MVFGLRINLAPEGRRLFPKLSVEENLLLGAVRPLARAEVARHLELVPCDLSALSRAVRGKI